MSKRQGLTERAVWGTLAQPGETLEGLAVVEWVTAQVLADQVLEISRRQLAHLEEKGLPVRGRGRGKRYPIPHCVIWSIRYQCRLAVARGRGVHRLSLRVALAEHAYQMAVEESEANGYVPIGALTEEDDDG